MSKALVELLNAPCRPAIAPIALAPMSGVTDIAFRRIADRLGAGWTVTEMVAASEFSAGSEESRLRAEGNAHVVQLAGRDPHWIAEASRVAEAAGAAVVDINMGCPAKKVVGGHGGSALMRDLDLATRIIDAAVKATTVPVTVKMRLGWEPSAPSAVELARRAEGAGARLLTVHGRYRSQFYEGRADWSAIAPVVAATSLPVVANGDIATLTDCRAALAASGAAGLMVGRAAQGQPWLPAQLMAGLRTGHVPAARSLAAQHAIAREHYTELLRLMGSSIGLRHARKHLAAYLQAAESASGKSLDDTARAALLTSTDPDDVLRRLGDAYSELEWREAA